MSEKAVSSRIEEIYNSGVTSPAEIARQVGSHYKYVDKVLRRKGLRRRGTAGHRTSDTGYQTQSDGGEATPGQGSPEHQASDIGQQTPDMGQRTPDMGQQTSDNEGGMMGEQENPKQQTSDMGQGTSDTEGDLGFEEGGAESRGGRRRETRTPVADDWGAWYRVYIPHQTMAKFNYLKDERLIDEDCPLSNWIIEATDFTVRWKYKLNIVVENVEEKEGERNHYEGRLDELLSRGEISQDAYLKAAGRKPIEERRQGG